MLNRSAKHTVQVPSKIWSAQRSVPKQMWVCPVAPARKEARVRRNILGAQWEVMYAALRG